MGRADATRAAYPDLCPVCIKRPPRKHHATCGICGKRNAEYSSERYHERREAGLCVLCGEPASEGWLCDPCRADHNAARRSKYAERRAAGLCVQCGEPSPDYLCEPHKEVQNARRRKS